MGGILLRREINEGARVKEGQVHSLMDPATYKVALDLADAQLQQAQETLCEAEENFKRL